MAVNNTSHKPYWASVPAKEIADEILEKVDKYYEYLSLSGRLDTYRRTWAYYYRTRISGARLNPVGQQGELTALSVNHYRNLLAHIETMTCQQRAAFEPRATNSDVKSQQQVILATGLLDYYMREKKMERNLKQSVKDGLIFGEAFVRVEWDATAGDIYGQSETGAPIYEGDIKYTNYIPLDVIRDYTKINPNRDEWYILRDYQNKFDLAAKFPDLANDILDDSTDMLEIARTTTLNVLSQLESDNVFVYSLLHKPTPAMPQGRYTLVLDNGTVLQDGAIPYDEAHVYRIAPDEETGTIFGYSVGFDLLPLQETIDMLYSTAATNQATFGVQNVLVPKGHDLSTAQIAGGLNIMEYDPKVGKPEALNLTQTPAEIFNFMIQIEKQMETISGVNSVARGNPESSLKSGAALALVQSQAIQFNQNLQQSYAQLIEDLGTGTVNILKTYARVPRVAAITGKSNRTNMKSFIGADLDQINRVIVDMGNPLTRTTAGKVNLAEQMMNFNLIENPDQYVQVINTGRLEPVIEGKQAQLLLIKSENESMADGKPVPVLVTDNHQKHILEHTVLLSSPEARSNPQLVQIALAHIQEHRNMMNDPMVQQLMAIIHAEVIPGPQMNPQGQAGAPQIGQMMDATNPLTQQAAQVNQPNMPAPPQGADATSAALIEAQQGPV